MGYSNVTYGKKSVRRNYSKMRYDVDLPDLIEIQTKSFKWFIDEGIKELLEDISPIEGHNGDLKLYFEEHFLSDPKYSAQESKIRDVTYAKQLSARVKLENAVTGEVRENVVLMCEIPFMTPSGTFVINGAERVVVSQIIRSAGAYFTGEIDKKLNQVKYMAQVIPTRGAWLEFELGSKNIMYAKLDRSKKIPLTTMMRALGFSKKKDIYEVFGKSSYIDSTFDKDETKNSDEAIIDLYSKLRQGEKVPADAAREFVRMRLFERRRYDLAAVGRYKFNKKLDVLRRIEGQYTATDIVDPETGEILVPKETKITRDIIKLLEQNRHVLRKEVITKDDSLQNETPDEILAVRLPDGGDGLYTKENIINLRTGEVLVAKNELITPEVISLLIRNRQSLDEKVIKYFLSSKDIYQKESERSGVIVETIEITVKDKELDKIYPVKVIGSDQRENREHVTLSDIIASMSYYLNLYDGIGETDDIDHLGNRRLRLIGELLKNQFRIGLARAEKNIKDKMSTTTFQDASPSNIINMTPLAGAIKTFFGSSQLSQFMDQINPLAELTQKRRVSALGTGGLARDRAGVEVRDVHNSHYGRICPIETPEGPSIGLISSLSSYGKVDQYGFIQTPYLKVDHSSGQPIPTQEIKYLTADEEDDEIIASAATALDENGVIIDEKVIGRHKGETSMFDKSEVTYMDVSPKQIVSVATATIPFLEHDDASRALMGANMQRQAVPLLSPEAPIVGTGVEYRAAKDSGAIITADVEGFVTYADGTKITITPRPDEIVSIGEKVIYDPKKNFTFEIAKALNDYGLGQERTYPLTTFFRSNQDTNILQRPIVKEQEYVNLGDVIADGPSVKDGELALGRNVTVAFMTWEGYNYEDAIILSEDLVQEDVYTSIHIDEYIIETRELKTGSGREEITKEVPNAGPEALKNLDEYGVVVPGSEVREGDILVGKITPKGVFEPSPSEKLIHAVLGEKSREYRDSSLRVPHGGGGIVQSIKYFNKKQGDTLPSGVNERIIVYVAKKRKISEGDKMAGRHGNKGVISRILPKEDMPYMADGTPIDIMLNPLGVPSRMNIGQILEIHLGIAAKNLGIKIATPVFDGLDNEDLQIIMKESRDKTEAMVAPKKPLDEMDELEKLNYELDQKMLARFGEDGKTVLYDGRTGEPFDNRVSVGVMYMIKLSHMVDDKLHARSVGPYTLVTQQPMGGKAQNGGQRFGEMEVWALYAYGAAHTLQEMLTIKSDDMIGRNRVFSSITHDRPIPQASVPESFRVLTRELQALGLYVELIDANTGENEATKSLVDHTRTAFTKGGYR
ncbi:MAG: DNA-directed RNA polymerase subunit beta [Acholeplasmataceae bacterium]|nr:DNA-directed RNA polymerase subunit beta [Acholeplasmataceae bacterium]